MGSQPCINLSCYASGAASRAHLAGRPARRARHVWRAHPMRLRL